jgi:hypothetical protein
MTVSSAFVALDAREIDRQSLSCTAPIQMNWTRIPHIQSMITVATIPATTAPTTMNRSAKRFAHTMRHNDRTPPSREMREDEEHAEPIMLHEADVPRVLGRDGKLLSVKSRRGC